MLFFLSWSWFAGNIDFLPAMNPEFLVKLNREFESNPLRQPVSPFLSLGGVLSENSILRPKTNPTQGKLRAHGLVANYLLVRCFMIVLRRVVQ